MASKGKHQTGAYLLVQAAREISAAGTGSGYLPCQFILFCDQSYYRMRTDWPHCKNIQLAKWFLKEILSEATTQAQLYGIKVPDSGAAFSSQYYAVNSALDARANIVCQLDLATPFF